MGDSSTAIVRRSGLPVGAVPPPYPIVCEASPTRMPIGRLVADGSFWTAFADVEFIGTRRDGLSSSMSLSRGVALNRGLNAGMQWYLSTNIHSRRAELVGTLPQMFNSWFDRLPREHRPQWTWVYVGGIGSGSVLHVDTMGSSAWNVVFAGKKSWRVLSPRRSERIGLLPAPVADSIPYCADVEYEFTQNAGELVVVPAGWAHEVVNEEDTIAVTGNFVNSSNIRTAEAMLRLRSDDTWLRIAQRVHQEMMQVERGGYVG